MTEDIRKAFEKAIDDGDAELALEIASDFDNEPDLYAAFRYAVSKDCLDYVREAAEDIDINDYDGSCSFLHDAVSDEMEELLFDLGAFRSWDEYDESSYKIAIETINGSILAFDDDFRDDVFQKVLKLLGQTEEEFISSVENNEKIENEEIGASDYEELCNLMFISVVEGEIVFEYCIDENGLDLYDFMEDSLGYNFDFEGESWKFETNGVYFIEQE